MRNLVLHSSSILLDMSDEFILSTLAQVKYPGFSGDIVSFGLVSDATLDENGKATVNLELSQRPAASNFLIDVSVTLWERSKKTKKKQHQ